MFDIGISEIMVIAVVALVVLGPEKLPKTARTLGHLFGRLQRYVADVKADINRELALEDMKKLQEEVKSAASDFQTSMTATAQEVEANVRAVEASLNDAAADAPAAAGTAGSSAPAVDTPLALAEPEASPQAAPQDAPRQASLPGFERG